MSFLVALPAGGVSSPDFEELLILLGLTLFVSIYLINYYKLFELVPVVVLEKLGAILNFLE